MARLTANLVSVYLLREAPAADPRPAQTRSDELPRDAPRPPAHLEVLLLQRRDDHRFPGDWQAVHGHVEPHEAAWQTALRELQEETGITPTSWFRLLRVGSFYEPDTDTVYFVPAFLAIAPPDVLFRLSAEHQDGVWSPLADARPRFRWVTQRDDIDAVIAATLHWPETGPELERIDLPALQTRWQARRLREDRPRGLD